MLNFRQALFKFAGPRLRTHGFVYDDNLRDRNIMYGFRRHLGGNVQAIILFQRSQSEERARGLAFTVNLVRSKTEDVKEWQHGMYDGYLQERLGLLLRIVYDIQSYPEVDHWWNPSSPDQYETEISDVLNRLEEYGIPWLEDPYSKPVFSPNLEKLDQYRNKIKSALQETISGELEVYGYGLREHANGNLFFIKALGEQINAFVSFEFRLVPKGDSPHLEFDVFLLRKNSDEPVMDSRIFSGEDLYVSLGQLLWYEYNVYPNKFMGWVTSYEERQDGVMVPIQVPPTKAFFWRFTNYEELRQQLQNDILSRLREYGLPWLENPNSRNPWLSTSAPGDIGNS